MLATRIQLHTRSCNGASHQCILEHIEIYALYSTTCMTYRAFAVLSLSCPPESTCVSNIVKCNGVCTHDTTCRECKSTVSLFSRRLCRCRCLRLCLSVCASLSLCSYVSAYVLVAVSLCVGVSLCGVRLTLPSLVPEHRAHILYSGRSGCIVSRTASARASPRLARVQLL